MSGMKAIIGLGNPEEKYALTRHNVGFMVVDRFAEELGIVLENSPKLFARAGKNADYLLAQPQNYMNRSGQAVQAVLDFYKLSPADLTIIHDDLDIAFGTYKIQQATGPKAHNGLLSIYEALGTDQFTHVRIGVENRQLDNRLSGKDYVLQAFAPAEIETLQAVIGQVAKELLR